MGFLFGVYLASKEGSRNTPTKNFHYSEIRQKYFYDDFFSQSNKCQSNYQLDVKGLIVNHHLLAGGLIADVFCSVATDRELTVVILSPNHFARGRGQVTTSIYDWATPYGILQSDQKLIKTISDAGVVAIDEGPFEREHGIYNLTPFVRKVLPHARIAPVIIKDNISQADRQRLIKFLSESLPKDSLIIASLDFSHYLTSSEADRNDEKTLEIIKSLDYEGVTELNPDNQPDNVDSKPVLEIMLQLMSLNNANNFTLLSNSNSAKLVGDSNVTETTSYINGFFSDKLEQE